MPSLIYEALRELDTTVSPVHTVNTNYVLTFSAKIYEPSREVRRTVHRSIGGAQEVVGQSYDKIWTVQPVPIVETDLEAWHEFLHSVQYGETFTFDPDDSSPLAGTLMVLDQEAWAFTRFETVNLFTLSPLRFREATV